MNKTRSAFGALLAFAVGILLILGYSATANAKTTYGFQIVKYHLVIRKTPKPTPPPPFIVGMGDIYTIGCANLPNDGSVVRVIVDFYSNPNRWYACAAEAVAAGHKLALTIQYATVWPLAQDQAWFQQALALYAPLHPWSVGIGNEEELRMSDGGPTLPSQQSDAYKANAYSNVWKAVEPIVAQMTPNAIRDGGEISPWGQDVIKLALQDGLPGVQALAAHPYPATGTDPNALTQFTSLAHSYGLPAWATEGMCGPGAWMQYGCRTEASLQTAGFALGDEWYFPVQASTAKVTITNGIGAPTDKTPGIPSSTSPIFPEGA